MRVVPTHQDGGAHVEAGTMVPRNSRRHVRMWGHLGQVQLLREYLKMHWVKF